MWQFFTLKLHLDTYTEGTSMNFAMKKRQPQKRKKEKKKEKKPKKKADILVNNSVIVEICKSSVQYFFVFKDMSDEHR